MPSPRRRLEDLYKRGEVIKIDDGDGEVEVWVRRPNPHEYESIGRRASAAKARYMRLTDDQDSDEWLSVYQGVRDYGDREGLIAVIIGEDVARAKARIEAELSAEDEWSEDDYLQSLVDAWTGSEGDEESLAVRYATDPEDPEARRVHDELDRFDTTANEKLEEEKANLHDQWADAEDERVFIAATDAMVRSDAEKAYRREFEYQQIFYSTFEVAMVPDPKNPKGKKVPGAGARYFGTMDPVRTLSEETILEMSVAIGGLTVGAVEGKDSPAPPASSDESEPAETEEVPSVDYGQVEQLA